MEVMISLKKVFMKHIHTHTHTHTFKCTASGILLQTTLHGFKKKSC